MALISNALWPVYTFIIKRLSGSFQMFELCYKFQDLWHIFKLCFFVLHLDAYTKKEFPPRTSAYARLLRIRMVLVSNLGPAILTNIFLRFRHSIWKKFQDKIPHIRNLPYATIATIHAAYI